MDEGYKLAVVGATGLVGREFLKLLESRAFPVRELRLLASERSSGRLLWFAHRQVEVAEVSSRSFSGMEVVFFFAGTDAASAFAHFAARAATLVIDTSAALSLEAGIPLVIADVNPEEIRPGIVVSPSAPAVQLLTVLSPLHRVNPLKSVTVVTLHSVSGTGSSAMEELSNQAKLVLQGHAAAPHVYPHQIAFNLLPETDVFLDNGHSRQEWQLVEEMRKILKQPHLPVSSAGVRVPVYIGHAQVVYAEFTQAIAPDDARGLLAGAPGVRVLDDLTVSLYPQPWSAAGQDEVFVGRIREDPGRPRSLAMWIVADNLRRGAALNALQIAEEAVARGILPPQPL